MPIPKTRAQLLGAMEPAYAKLNSDLDRLSARAARQVCVDDWSVVDVLTVRTWWAHAVVSWIEAGQRDETPPIPAAGFSWRQTPALNDSIIARAPKRRSWSRVRTDLDESYDAVLAALQGLGDEELERTGTFVWAGRWPVVRWVSVSTTTGYASARRFVRAMLRHAAI
ncbi:MAG: ClbS/DfsB family four-helix bundle protein [Myxococcota bacterium]